MVTQSIPLVADLRTQNRNIGTIYLATGLVAEGDTGGGIYFWNPSSTNADDGFYYLQVTGVATGRWVRIYAGSNIYNTDGSLLDDRDVTLNSKYLKFIGSSANSTFNADGSVTLGSLSGVNTRMVVANNAGTLGTQSFIPGTTIRFVEKFTATLGQTVFNTTNTLYNDLFDVFLNGVKLNTDSFSFTANQIVLADGSYADDVIDVVGFSSVTVYATLPSQTGNAGKYLSTNGTSLSWEFVDGGFVPYTGATANVDLGEYELKAGQVEFDQTPTGTAGVGVMRWNDSDGTVDLGLKGGNVTLQVGQEQVLRVVNKTGADLLESQYRAVRIRLVSEGGSQGQRLAVVLAQGDNDPDSTTTIGIVTETIANNQEGFITTSGEVRGINTTGSLQGETWLDGDIIYLSPTIAGGITKVKPTAPDHMVVLGYVIYAHANNGKIFVKVDNGYELGELHDVYVPSPSNNDGIFWNTANSRYQNNSITGVLGYTPVPTTRTITINGTTLDLSADRTYTVSASATPAGANTQIQYNNSGVFGASAGLVYNDSTGAMTLSKNHNAPTSLLIKNLTVGTNAYPQLELTNDSGYFNIFKVSSGYTPFKIIQPKDAGYFNSSAGGGDFAFLNDFINGKFKWAMGGSSTAQMTLTAAGRLLLGTTTESTFLLDVNGTARVSNRLTISGHTSNIYLSIGTGTGNAQFYWSAYVLSIGGVKVAVENLIADPSGSSGGANRANSSIDCRGYLVTDSIGIGTTTNTINASAITQIDSTTKGFLPPRMTNAQRAAISSPAVGLIVYCTDATEGLYQYINNAWVNLTGIVTNRQTASYTLALGDSNDLVEMNVATANNLTVPLNSVVAFPIGTKIDIAQYGAGQTTVVATGGVTVRSAGGALKLALQYSGASLVKIGTDEWYLFGDITV